jgi:hypothetical protein
LTAWTLSPPTRRAGKTLNGELSIRKGRYGHYVYYKTAGMSVPKFFNIKKFKGSIWTATPKRLFLGYSTYLD